jgi:tetratricopeptide (TPR) repeat protein
MELTLAHQAGSQILVTCNNQPSHTFDLFTLIPHEKGLPQPLDDPVAYGQALYSALFPPETLAQRALTNTPERILLVTSDNDLDAIPWEYIYGPDGFFVLECHFVRGLLPDQRINPPTLDTGMHIVAVPSNPLSQLVEPLNIDGEWMRLKDIIQHVPYAITLERTRPPTIEQLRTLVANQHNRVIHFMGHSGQQEAGTVLCFEKDNGDLDLVTAKQFMLRVRGTVFLVTLNACVTATPGATSFSNLAAALVRQRTPYALGMRFSIPDDEARSFSRTFYSDLARGSSVEEALLQARLTLANSPHSWVVGVPVLYTSLTQPAVGFHSQAGSPLIKEHQPRLEVSTIPRAEGTFQGRIDELRALGTTLTGDSRPPLVTIHGAGGQGKTALAREAVERFAYAWPGGVWATSLENLPNRELFVNDLARFLGIETQTIADPEEVEHLVLARLAQSQLLIVLDNAETLVEAIEANNEEAIHLAQFLREQVPSPSVSLLATSRSFLGWASEVGYELDGLAARDGAKLLQQIIPLRREEIEITKAWELSNKVHGHPLSLRLLGSAFNASRQPFPAFIEEYEANLVKSEDKYKNVDHRQRTLYASIETSIRHLDSEMRTLLSGLWVFHAPFMAGIASAMFGPEPDGTERKRSPVYDHLYMLWQRSLLTREVISTSKETLVNLYHLLPTVRPYIEREMEQAYDRELLFAWFGMGCFVLCKEIFSELDRSPIWVYIARQTREDLERGVAYIAQQIQGNYLLMLVAIIRRFGDTKRALELAERALEIAQGQDQHLEWRALDILAELCKVRGQPHRALALYEQAIQIIHNLGNQTIEAMIFSNMAIVYLAIGQSKQALEFYEKALPILQKAGDRDAEASVYSNMAKVYTQTGQLKRAIEMNERTLPILREMGNRTSETITLNNMAMTYYHLGQSEQAIKLYKQALPIARALDNKSHEALILNNMAMVYHSLERPQLALQLYEQALPLRREVGDLSGEASTLTNIAQIYDSFGQPQLALQLYEQALPLRREVGDLFGEAITLNNIATTYDTLGQSKRALELYEQALSLERVVGDRIHEALTLSNMAGVFRVMGQPQRALELYEQAVLIKHELGNPADEATSLHYLATLLYQQFGRTGEAIAKMEQALALLQAGGLSKDKEGHTVQDLMEVLQVMRDGGSLGERASGLSTMPTTRISQIASNTVAVIKTMPERRAQWREKITRASMESQQQGRQSDVDFFTAVIAMLDGETPMLPADHPYASALAKIQADIASSVPQSEEEGGYEKDDISLDDALIHRSIVALLGGEELRRAHLHYLETRSKQAKDEGLKSLIHVIRLALIGGDLSQLGQQLSGMYRAAWERIVMVVETEGVDPLLLEMIVWNTRAVLGPAAIQRGEWHETLTQIKDQVKEGNSSDLVELIDAVIALLDAGGNPSGLGNRLKGIYAKTWLAIVGELSN